MENQAWYNLHLFSNDQFVVLLPINAQALLQRYITNIITLFFKFINFLQKTHLVSIPLYLLKHIFILWDIGILGNGLLPYLEKTNGLKAKAESITIKISKTFIMYVQYRNTGKPSHFFFKFGAIKSKDINMIATIG